MIRCGSDELLRYVVLVKHFHMYWFMKSCSKHIISKLGFEQMLLAWNVIWIMRVPRTKWQTFYAFQTMFLYVTGLMKQGYQEEERMRLQQDSTSPKERPDKRNTALWSQPPSHSVKGLFRRSTLLWLTWIDNSIIVRSTPWRCLVQPRTLYSSVRTFTHIFYGEWELHLNQQNVWPLFKWVWNRNVVKSNDCAQVRRHFQ